MSQQIMKKKRTRLYQVLTAVSGIVICFCYFNYLISSLVTNASVITAFVITLAVLCAVLLPVCFRKRLKKLLKKAYPAFCCVYTLGMWAYLIVFTVFCVFIVSYNSSPKDVYSTYEQDEQLVIITFGCKTYGMTPGKALRNRLNVTYELLEHFPNAVTVVSGGQGADETNSEAIAMHSYLVEKGIDENRIIMEDESTNTIENLQNSLCLIEEYGWSEVPIIGVSHNYHAPRIKLLGRRFGVALTLAGYQTFDFAGITREFMAYVKLFLFQGNIG